MKNLLRFIEDYFEYYSCDSCERIICNSDGIPIGSAGGTETFGKLTGEKK